MNVLLLGSGGREHALAWKINQSNALDKLFIAPGNAGTEELGENVSLDVSDFEAVKNFVLHNHIGLVVVGPEAPLVDGLGDYFAETDTLKNVLFFGPQKQGATLEGSKDWSKAFMMRHNIPTAQSQSFTIDTLQEGIKYLETRKAPYVLKADGLAAGKGVLILNDLKEAQQELTLMLKDQKFGDASAKVVIEDFLSGIELSVFVITDGKNYALLPEAKDYKRIGEGDTGLNTGGMGSISPVPFANKAFMQKIEDRIIIPTIEGLQKEKIPYCGFIFFGLIKVDDDPYVIEYNARMGDPEAESVIPRIKSDLLTLMIDAARGDLKQQPVEVDERFATAVMMVSGGYPESYEKGIVMTGFEKVSDSFLFHAGTKKQNNQVVTSGGRVIAITSFGDTMHEALETSYRNCKKVSFDKSYYRTDLGDDLKK